MIRIFSRSLALLATLALFAGTLARAEDYVPTVLVTGANRGIGLELTRQYAARGWKVIATARKPAEATELAALASKSEGRVSIETLDVTERTVQRLWQKARQQEQLALVRREERGIDELVASRWVRRAGTERANQ